MKTPTPAAGTAVTIQRAEQSRRQRFDPLPNLTPELLVNYLQSFDYGYLGMAARTWHAMERRDDRLFAVAPKAKGALSNYGYEILTADNLPAGQKAEAAAHKEALEFFYGNVTAVNAVDENETGGFTLFAKQAADALGKRYSAHEIVWQPGNDGLTAELRHAPLWFLENLTGRLRFLDQDGAVEGRPMEPDAWHVCAGAGLMEACSVLYLFKHYPLKDWLVFCERFGSPSVLGKTNAAEGSPEWIAMENAVARFGVDFAAVVNGDDAIELIERKSGGERTPFEGLIERSDRAMSILWRGADLGTQGHSSGGKGTGASLQGDETDKLDKERAGWLQESLIGLSRKVIRFTFGEGVRPLAFLKVKTEVKRDINLELVVDDWLLKSGAPLSVADVLVRYDRPMPAEGELLLKAPAAVGAGGDPGQQAGQEASLENAANVRSQIQDAARRLQTTSRLEVARAQTVDRAPVRERIEAIMGIEDAAVQQAALAKFQRDLPTMLVGAGRDSAATRALAASLSASLFNGLVGGAVGVHAPRTAVNFNPNHGERGLFASGPDNGGSGGGGGEGSYNAPAQIARGLAAARRAQAEQADVLHAMDHPQLGSVDFRWGKPGDPAREYAGGSGISHILAKHGEADLLKMPEAIARGQTTMGTTRAVIVYNGYRVTLSNNHFGTPTNYWAVSGFTLDPNHKKGGGR